jgi:ribosomal protein S1
VPVTTFRWPLANSSTGKPMAESFSELFEQSLKEINMQPGSIVSGTVVDIDSDWITVHGRNRLSREKAKRAMVWDELEEGLEANETVVGRINGKVKGGFTVDIKDIRAFLPGSLVDVRPVRDTGYLEGKELEFKVIKLDQKRNNVVVSRRAVVEPPTAPSASAAGIAAGRRRQGRGQEPDRLRRVRRSGRHRRPAAHHRHGVEARQAPVRSRQRRRRDRRQAC